MTVTQHLHHEQLIQNNSLHNQVLEYVQSAKYLEDTISDNLDWDQHISDVSTKATKTLGFLHRNLSLAPKETKEAEYKTLMHPKQIMQLQSGILI